MRRFVSRLSLLATIAAVSCLAIGLDATGKDKKGSELPLGLKAMKIPADNPQTAAKIELGKQLYFDKRLSVDNTVSCASCHDPNKGWSNGEKFATGVRGQMGGRSAPTIINSGYVHLQFWDGRAEALEGQALGPIANPIEMDLPIEKAVEKIAAIPGYKKQFKKVFKSGVTSDGIAKAISAFERTIVSGNAPYDQFKAGDENALSDSAKRGMDLFFNKAKCAACHKGESFTDGAFHNIGVGYAEENGEPADVGRFAVTNQLGDKGAFKTPTLREIAKTAPYMHDGSVATLEEVVKFYNKGGVKSPQLSEDIFPLKLNEQDIQDIVNFMKEGLSSEDYPHVDPPELP